MIYETSLQWMQLVLFLKPLEEVTAYLLVMRRVFLQEVDLLHPTYPGSGHDGGVAIFLL